MAMAAPIDEHRKRLEIALRESVAAKDCQPILFIGAGLSRRYFGAPDWHGALKSALDALSDGGPDYHYYVQRYDSDPIKVGSALAERVHEWAWTAGRNKFPSELFETSLSAGTFLKFLIAEQLKAITPTWEASCTGAYAAELRSLRSIRPHAIITTNFDCFLENLFEGYEAIVGQSLIKYNMNSFGEIFKIHGSVTDASSMVLLARDFEEFAARKKYISAKLLTYFIEHPVFIFGYGLNDPNVLTILEDVGEVIADSEGFIKNIFYIKWQPNFESNTTLPEMHVFSRADRHYRVRAVYTDHLGWVYDALAASQELRSINTKLVRALAARAYKLIRSDIPRGTVEVDYDVLERVADKEAELPKLLGIVQANNTNLTHPLVLSQVGRKLGFPSWHGASKLLDEVKRTTGIDIRKSDNRYHCKVRIGSGKKSETRKWSTAVIDLLAKVKAGEPYTVDL